MKTLFAFGCWLASVNLLAGECPCPVDDFPDGIYFLSEPGTGHRLPRIDSKVHSDVWVDELATGELGQAKLQSLCNSNSQFRLVLDHCGPFPAGKPVIGRTAIVIGGKACVINGGSIVDQPDQNRDDLPSVATLIFGLENARSVAKLLNVDLEERKHPGHLIQITWSPAKDAYLIGQPVEIALAIENVGLIPIRFFDGGQNRGARNNQFQFICFGGHGMGRPVSDTGDPIHFGGLAGYVELKPGETFRKSIDVTSWFTFPQADTYRLTCVYAMELHSGAVWNPIWDDFATGYCEVTIANDPEKTLNRRGDRIRAGFPQTRPSSPVDSWYIGNIRFPFSIAVTVDLNAIAVHFFIAVDCRRWFMPAGRRAVS
jgi:hypothetical protein